MDKERHELEKILLDKEEALEACSKWSIDDRTKEFLKINSNKMQFKLKGSFAILDDSLLICSIMSPKTSEAIGSICIPFEELEHIELRKAEGGFWSLDTGGFYYRDIKIESFFDCSNFATFEFSKKVWLLFKDLIKQKLKKNEEQESNLSKRNEDLNNMILQLDKDGNGIVDVAESNDVLLKLVNTKQSKIIAIDKEYLQKFVRISNHLKYKKESIQVTFSILLEEKERFESEKKKKNELLTDPEIDNLIIYFEDLNNEIFEYNLLLVHSLNMLVALTDDENLLTFYQIHEVFDQLNIFNSSWENGVFQKLNGIRDGIDDLSRSIDYLSDRLSSKIDEMNYITQDSFKNLQNTVTKELNFINSNLEYNNILSTIQTYQLYKISKHTKRR